MACRPGFLQALTAVTTGHIPGTSRRDLLTTVEKRRDLSRRSDLMHGTFAMVNDMLAQDPAYRLAHRSAASRDAC